MQEYSVWDYAPNLPPALVALLLGRPLESDVYERIASLLLRIDEARSKPFTVVELIINYIGMDEIT